MHRAAFAGVGYPVGRRSFFKLCAAFGVAAASCMLDGCAAGSPNALSTGAANGEGKADGGSAVTGDPPAAALQYEELTRTFFAFDTAVMLKACCSQDTMDQAEELCAYFESLFSRTVDSSDVARVNAAGGAPVQVASETADLVKKALAYCEESGGLFDITIGAVSSLWDFKAGIVPDADELAEAVKHVDYRAVTVEGSTVALADPQAKLDLGGIAKGYIADALCSHFERAGCDCGFVNLGGNVKTIGCKPDGSPWKVGVQDPNDAQGSIIASLDAAGTSIVTSGLYERQFELDGERYWHILDPRTGWPVRSDVLSATIVSSASIDGDGYTKPLFMMGADEALAWINAKDGIEGLVVNSAGASLLSTGCTAEVR